MSWLLLSAIIFFFIAIANLLRKPSLKFIEKMVKLTENSEINELFVSEFFGMISVRIQVKVEEEVSKKNVHHLTYGIIHKSLNSDYPEYDLVDVESPVIGTVLIDETDKKRIKIGEFVAKGDVVCRIMSLGISIDIKSEIEGKISKIYYKEDTIVEYGQPLVQIQKK